MLMYFEMFGHLIDAPGQDGYLDFWRTSIGFVIRESRMISVFSSSVNATLVFHLL